MKNKLILGIAAMLMLMAIIAQLPHARPDFSGAHHFDDALVSNLDAQTPVYTNLPNGAIAVTGMGSGVTGSLLAPQSVILTSPGASTALQIASTNTLRNYVYDVSCYNTSATATVAILWDSGTTASATTPTVTQIAYVPCPLSLVNAQSGGHVVFNPPLRLRPGSALGISTHVSVTTAFYYADGFTAK